MRHFVKLSYRVLLVPLMSGTLWSNVQIVPTPQYLEVLNHSLAVTNGVRIEIVVGSSGAASSPKMKLAADFLREALNQASGSVQVRITDKHPSGAGAAIHLWNWATDRTPPIPLNLLDWQTLSDSNHYGQGYIIRAPNPTSIWALGSSDQGVLMAVMTILQSIRRSSSGIEIPGVYVRDYPNFE
jgi:Glycosyl hydrolase family 20, domain 2